MPDKRARLIANLNRSSINSLSGDRSLLIAVNGLECATVTM